MYLKMVLSILDSEEFEALLLKNPLHYVKISIHPVSSTSELSDQQRYILKRLVEREGTPRGAALRHEVAHRMLSDKGWSLEELSLLFRSRDQRWEPIDSNHRPLYDADAASLSEADELLR